MSNKCSIRNLLSPFIQIYTLFQSMPDPEEPGARPLFSILIHPLPRGILLLRLSPRPPSGRMVPEPLVERPDRGGCRARAADRGFQPRRLEVLGGKASSRRAVRESNPSCSLKISLLFQSTLFIMLYINAQIYSNQARVFSSGGAPLRTRRKIAWHFLRSQGMDALLCRPRDGQ